MDGDSPPHLRIALILLDNVAEVLIMRHLEQMFGEVDDDGSVSVAVTLRSGRTSLNADAFKKLRWDFSRKVKFLEDADIIEDLVGACLTRLHRYRNEAQHRDVLRRRTLGPATRIYLDLIGPLLSSYKRPRLEHSVWFETAAEHRHWFETHYPTVAKYTDADSGNQEADVAWKFYRWYNAGTDDSRVALQTFLLARVDELEAQLEELLPQHYSKSGDTLTLHSVLRHIQDTARDKGQKFPVTYNVKVLNGWRERANKLTNVLDKYDAFARFADIEEELERCVEMVTDYYDNELVPSALAALFTAMTRRRPPEKSQGT